MTFSKTTLLAILLPLAWNVSSSNAATGSLRTRRLAANAECTLLVSQALMIDPSGHDDEGEEFECQLDAYETGGVANQAFPLEITKEQRQEFKELLREGDVVPGDSRLDVEGGIWDGTSVKIPPGKVKKKVKKGKKVSDSRRRLAIVTGEKP
ncbi:MAG: hypothetical protein SGILL_007301, partial [Bacillariaceae sp.]